jgi:hypothetical protein
MWDAFAASMNTGKEYPTFEELWTCCAQEESMISAKEKPQKKYDDQAFTTRFKNFRNKRKFGSRRMLKCNKGCPHSCFCKVFHCIKSWGGHKVIFPRHVLFVK